MVAQKANAPFECGNRPIIIQMSEVIDPGVGWNSPVVLTFSSIV